MGFFFSLGLTFLVIAAFIGVPKLVVTDFYPYLARQNKELFTKWTAAIVVVSALGCLFLVIALLILIWS